MIRTHRGYLTDDHDLDWLRAELAPLRARIQTLLQKGVRGRDQKSANFCAGLLAEYDALWDLLRRRRPPDPDHQQRGGASAPPRGHSPSGLKAVPNPTKAADGSSGSSHSAKRCASKSDQYSTT